MQSQNTGTSSLTTQMGKLSVSGSGPSGDNGNNTFPIRPSFGTAGQRIILWANYFKMDVKPLPMYKYSLTVNRLDKPARKPAVDTSDPKGKPLDKSEDDSASKTVEVKGAKLAKIIALALKKLRSAGPIASEFKQQVISVRKLDLPENGIIEVLLEDTSRPEKWAVNFNVGHGAGPESVYIDKLVEYLKTMKDPGNEAVFPKFPTEIDALNVVLGHTARSDGNAATGGSGRFFATDTARIEAADGQRGQAIDILRGYFQSVRPATGRLLLNTNVTHGIFRRPGNVGALLKEMGLAKMTAPMDNQVMRQYERALRDLNKFLALARVQIRTPKTKNQQPTVSFSTMAGLCTTRDGTDRRGKSIDGEEQPQFQFPTFLFSGPGSVKFFLGEPKPKDPNGGIPPAPQGLKYDTYVKVSDYYKASK